jgi:hypothetical protein
MTSTPDTEKAETKMSEKVDHLPGESSLSNIQDHPKVNTNSV